MIYFAFNQSENIGLGRSGRYGQKFSWAPVRGFTTLPDKAFILDNFLQIVDNKSLKVHFQNVIIVFCQSLLVRS